MYIYIYDYTHIYIYYPHHIILLHDTISHLPSQFSDTIFPPKATNFSPVFRTSSSSVKRHGDLLPWWPWYRRPVPVLVRGAAVAASPPGWPDAGTSIFFVFFCQKKWGFNQQQWGFNMI